jgi:hypothetical protein
MAATTSSSDENANVGKTLNLFRGVGFGSRFNFCTEKLVALGWTLNEREHVSGGRKRKMVSFVDPSGKKFRSGKDVERYMIENNLWEKVKRVNQVEVEDEITHSRDGCDDEAVDACESINIDSDTSDEDFVPTEVSFNDTDLNSNEE